MKDIFKRLSNDIKIFIKDNGLNNPFFLVVLVFGIIALLIAEWIG